MNKNYFETVFDKIEKTISKGEVTRLNDFSFKVTNKQHSYEISNDTKKRVIFLKEILPGSESILSSWMFDEERLSQKDMNLIVNDFTDIILKTPKTNLKPSRKKSSDESNVTGLYFANRMVSIFPEIKDSVLNEKQNYMEFRTVEFTKNILLPKINTLLNSSNNSETIKKFAKLLSSLYQTATLDVRSVITMGILNNIQNPEVLIPLLSEELQKAHTCALKYKGKKVKPEKIKNKSSWITKAMKYQEESKKL